MASLIGCSSTIIYNMEFIMKYNTEAGRCAMGDGGDQGDRGHIWFFGYWGTPYSRVPTP